MQQGDLAQPKINNYKKERKKERNDKGNKKYSMINENKDKRVLAEVTVRMKCRVLNAYIKIFLNLKSIS